MKIGHGWSAAVLAVWPVGCHSALRVQRVGADQGVQPKAVKRAAVRTTDESVLLSRLQTALWHATIFINAPSAYTCCPHLRQARPSPSLEDGFTLARGRPPSRTLKIHVILPGAVCEETFSFCGGASPFVNWKGKETLSTHCVQTTLMARLIASIARRLYAAGEKLCIVCVCLVL